jgi:hypothetical protein
MKPNSLATVQQSQQQSRTEENLGIETSHAKLGLYFIFFIAYSYTACNAWNGRTLFRDYLRFSIVVDFVMMMSTGEFSLRRVSRGTGRDVTSLDKRQGQILGGGYVTLDPILTACSENYPS